MTTSDSILKFVGTGNAFNAALGNNAAYLLQGDQLLLIDCGGSVFHRLLERGILDGVRELVVLITHTHPDHVGSLGDLIFYSHYIQNIPIRVVTMAAQLSNLLDLLGVNRSLYALEVWPAGAEGTLGQYLRAETVPVTHHPRLVSAGFILRIRDLRRCDEKVVYYSGDSRNIDQEILQKLQDGYFDYFYQDTCSFDFPGNPHLPLEKLAELVPRDFRSKVWCMHLDSDFDYRRAQELGFQTASA